MDYQKQLLYLINEYQNNKYSTNDFCDQFTLIFNRNYRSENLSSSECAFLQKICYLAERFSPYEEDVKNGNGYFIDENEFKKKFAIIMREVGGEF